jgi:hypothetical protein
MVAVVSGCSGQWSVVSSQWSVGSWQRKDPCEIDLKYLLYWMDLSCLRFRAENAGG